jgi:uncharacterized Rmd1/YagE family protein
MTPSPSGARTDGRKTSAPPEPSVVQVTAYLLGGSIDTKGLSRDERLASPVTVRLTHGGVAFVFRYGAVVFCNADPQEKSELLASLALRASEPLETPEIEETHLKVQPDADESGAALSGIISLRDAAPERLQIVAHVLAKSIVLAHYEAKISSVFDQVEPLAEHLMRTGRTPYDIRTMLQKIGYLLVTQQRVVGRVEIDEKPDVLWDHPELERLHARLEDEYELRERSRAIERKLDLLQDQLATLVDLVQEKRSTRLEWLVIMLIVIEVALSGYEAFHRFLGG